MKTNVIVNLKFAAVHNWPGCDLGEVDYLRNPHRHEFHITCKKEVNHSDRDIEFIMLKNSILKHLVKRYHSDRYGCGNLGAMSCEMLAEELTSQFGLNYCSVMEDNENGAEVTI